MPKKKKIVITDPNGSWGEISGTLSAQPDLQSELDDKSDSSHNHDAAYEAIGAVAAHAAAADPHTGYQKESEKNAASGYAGLSASSKLTGSQQVYGTGANTACEGNDARLSDARSPTAHKTSHENGGGDEISVVGLSGLLADSQTPLAHAASHKSGGSDAVKLDELAAPTDVTTLNATTAIHGLLRKLDGLTTTFLRGDGTWAEPEAGGGGAWGDITGTLADQTDLQTALDGKSATSHDHDADYEVIGAVAAHEVAADPHTGYQKESEKNAANGYPGLSAASKLTGSQQVYGVGANTACEGNDARLSDARTPTAHKASHENNGGDELSVTGLSGLLADAQTPLTHSHPESEVTGLIADLAAKSPTSHNHDVVYEPIGLVATHAAAADPHVGYQKESEKGAASGYASLDSGTKVPTAELGTGAPDGTKFLRDDRTWVTPTAGASDTNPNLYITAADYNLTASRSLYFPAEYEIGNGFVTDLAASSIMEIG